MGGGSGLGVGFLFVLAVVVVVGEVERVGKGGLTVGLRDGAGRPGVGLVEMASVSVDGFVKFEGVVSKVSTSSR